MSTSVLSAGLPSIITDLQVETVKALQCVPGIGQGACDDTLMSGIPAGSPLIKTDFAPFVAMPPAVLGSYSLCALYDI